MGAAFEALGAAETPAGVIRLWRRHDPRLGTDVYEVKLGDEYLMTSLFPESEIALATLALGRLDTDSIDVAVGGLGLGFTAMAALADDRVASLLVVDAVRAVIQWHRDGLVPAAAGLADDPRTSLVTGDFFALAQSATGLDPASPQRTFDAILVDIDHTPEHHLDGGHRGFYTADGLARTARHLRAGGVFALWSDGGPIDAFTALLAQVLDDVEARVVAFDNVLTGSESHDTVYLGRRRD